jgi:hypothetical protein
MLHHVDSGNAHRAAGGQAARGADADRGRLAGAVGAEQAEDFALVQLKVNAVDRHHAKL